MNPDTIPTVVNKTLDVLSARFGATGAALWQTLVGYARFNALAWMLGGVISVGIMLWFIAHWEPEDDDLYILKYIGAALCILVIALFVAGNIADVLYPQATVIIWIASGAK